MTNLPYDQSIAQLRSMLAETEFNTFWAEGRAILMDEAIAYALKIRKSESINPAHAMYNHPQ